MKMLRVVLFIGLAVQSVLGACPLGWPQFGNFCFGFSEESVTWLVAFSACNALSGRLVQIESQAKHDWIVKELKTRQITEVWIGGERRYSETWQWAPSEKQFKVYTNWDDGEPNNPSTEHCLQLRAVDGYKWNNNKCESSYRFVCERKAS